MEKQVFVEYRQFPNRVIAWTYSYPGQREVEVIRILAARDGEDDELLAYTYPMNGRYGARSANPEDYPEYVKAAKEFNPFVFCVYHRTRVGASESRGFIASFATRDEAEAEIVRLKADDEEMYARGAYSSDTRIEYEIREN